MTRVLLVEDEPLVREALAAMLRDASHDVVAVASAVDALSAMLDPAATFDAAVLDLTLGEHSETLHRALARAGVPVLLVSGKDPDALPAHAREHGWAYLAKPVEAHAMRDALDRIINPEPPMADTPADTSGVRQRPRVVVAAPVPTAVQLVDKLTAIAAIAAITVLAMEGKFSIEIAGAILAAGAVDSIPRGIASARLGSAQGASAGSGGAALGLVGLGLMSALHRAPSPPRAPAGPAVVQASAVGALVILVALALGALGCDPVRQAAVDTQSPRVGCVALSHRCHDGAPEVCSHAGRWWASLPRSPSGDPRRCAGGCEIVDGVAGCSSVVTP